MKIVKCLLSFVVLALMLFLCNGAKAVDILQNTNSGGTDWNTASVWANGLAPLANTNYVSIVASSNGLNATVWGIAIGVGRVREGTTASTAFAGGSLTIVPGVELLLKSGNGATATANLIFTNYFNTTGAVLVRNNGVDSTLAGTIANWMDSYLAADLSATTPSATSKERLTISSTVVGDANHSITLLTGSTPSGGKGLFPNTGTNRVTGDWSGFLGTLNLGNASDMCSNGVYELNPSATMQNLSLTMARVDETLILDKAITVQSFSITNHAVAAGTYAASDLTALGYGGTFSGTGSLIVGNSVGRAMHFAATAGNSQATLTWSAVAGAGGYVLQRGTSSGSYDTTIAVGNVLNYADIGLVNGTSYYYVLVATNGTDSGANSIELSVTPKPLPAPTLVTVTPNTPPQVSLSWTPVDQATGYYVQRSTTAGGPYTDYTNFVSGLNGTNYTDNQVLSGTTYYYVVAAANSGGLGLYSVEKSATTPNSPPAVPANLVAAAQTGVDQVTLSWRASFGATYNIYRGTSSGAETLLVNTGGTTASYVDTGLETGATYFYQVTAVGADGESAPSAEVSVVAGFVMEASTAAAAGTSWNLTSQWVGGVAPMDNGVVYVLSTNTTGSAGEGTAVWGVNFGSGRIRTPGSSSGSDIFGGSQLIVASGSELLIKETGGAVSANLIFTNYYNNPAYSPLVKLGANASADVTLSGIIVNQTDSYLGADLASTPAARLTVSAAVSGSGNITLLTGKSSTPTAAAPANSVTNMITGDWSAFDGTLNLGNASIMCGNGVYELNPSVALLTNLSLTMGQTGIVVVLDEAITVKSFSIVDNVVADGIYTPAQLQDLGFGGTFAGNGTLTVGTVVPPTPTSPHMGDISVSGMSLTITATNGLAGGSWVLLQSTNLALPVDQWETNSTGLFDGSGSLSTNILDTVTNSQEFYLLKVQ